MSESHPRDLSKMDFTELKPLPVTIHKTDSQDRPEVIEYMGESFDNSRITTVLMGLLAQEKKRVEELQEQMTDISAKVSEVLALAKDMSLKSEER